MTEPRNQVPNVGDTYIVAAYQHDLVQEKCLSLGDYFGWQRGNRQLDELVRPLSNVAQDELCVDVSAVDVQRASGEGIYSSKSTMKSARLRGIIPTLHRPWHQLFVQVRMTPRSAVSLHHHPGSELPLLHGVAYARLEELRCQ